MTGESLTVGMADKSLVVLTGRIMLKFCVQDYLNGMEQIKLSFLSPIYQSIDTMLRRDTYVLS